ncbi:hypothetical protein [Brevibacillus daliensis]|uniref:hypothetical protein n=1 Tax=Brevibacillus daliensis TaxID=2892995 RepID=UPI001E4A48DA|nr:hypothetical protein [Brevibacillus daliensis]
MKIIFRNLIVVLILGYFNDATELVDTQATTYLENKGYSIESYEGIVDQYILTKQHLVTLPHMMYWELQEVDPSLYIGKNIIVKKFIVTHHPLSEGKVEAFVYEVDKKPIGGTAQPMSRERMVGGYFSIDGKTVEELHFRSFLSWQDEWLKKYENEE